jgi:predicted ATPase/class 3 adenylate cyclase
MDALNSYIAADRRLALAGARVLPERSSGVALFADVSGFTALSEALAISLGARRGAEELSGHLNLVYEALIAEVDSHGGSVVAFAGDAITCWFDGDDGIRAATAAVAMQTAMQRFAEIRLGDGQTRSLAVKVGLARGPVLRVLVGHSHIHLLDVIAGRTLNRMAEAAAAAQRHEVVVSPEIAESLGGVAEIREWRTGKESGARYAVIERVFVCPCGPFRPDSPALDVETLRPHLLRPVCERLRSGHGEFLTELRPAVALFLRFDGIDYDRDDGAGARLNAYVKWVQEVVEDYGGFLLAVGMGDKGSYLYCCFGAPVTHENSAFRAVAAADKLRQTPPELGFITTTQIGINSGTLRTGAYGSTSRRTYGVLGDPVNLAARLMEHAAPGQVLVTEQVRGAVREAFTWQAFAPLRAKGKSGLVDIFALLGAAEGSRSGLVEPQYSLPLVGRRQDANKLKELIERVLGGAGQVVKITAEAGLGKSRLAAEAIRLARREGLTVFAGQCLSHGTNTSYLPWQSIWQGIFAIDEGARDPRDALESRLREWDASLLPRLPLLSAVLNVPVPDNEVTAPLEARLRKASLEALLVDCLRHASKGHPLLIVLEDCHWIDSLSADLLEVLARSIRDYRVLLLCTERPPEAGKAGPAPGLELLRHFSSIHLAAFSPEEAQILIKLKLAQLFGVAGDPPAALVERLATRAAGNPFYLEELLNFLRDRSPDLNQNLENLELPSSLHTLILSRIDRLTEGEQATLKLASVIGRLFPAAVLCGLRAGARQQEIEADLSALCKAELTALDRPQPEAVYIFKHVITQEVTYESLPHSTRERLHEQIGLSLETIYAVRITQHLDLLAFHFDRSPNLEKKRDYLFRAGEAAQGRYANAAAISYYERLLPLVPPGDKVPVLLKLGKVRELLGEWKKAGAAYQMAFEAAESLNDRHAQARCLVATADLLRKQGLFPEAVNWFGIAQNVFEELNDAEGVGQTLHGAGTVAAMQGDYTKASALYRQSLELRRSLEDKVQTAALLNNLGIIARFRAQYGEAQTLMQQSLALRRQVGDRWAVANSLNNIGVLYRDMGQPALARPQLEESLLLNRQVGDRWAVANVLSSLGEASADLKDWASAAQVLDESLTMNLELGDRTAIAFILEAFAGIAAGLGEPGTALKLVGNASGLRELMGSPLSPGEQKNLERTLAPARRLLRPESQIDCFAEGKRWELGQAVSVARQLASLAIGGIPGI